MCSVTDRLSKESQMLHPDFRKGLISDDTVGYSFHSNNDTQSTNILKLSKFANKTTNVILNLHLKNLSHLRKSINLT